MGLEIEATFIDIDKDTLRKQLKALGGELDTWPWLPSFVEIEGQSPEAVRNIADKLDFDMGEAHYGLVDEIYKIYYDVTNEQINFCPEIKFTNLPEWLVAKQK